MELILVLLAFLLTVLIFVFLITMLYYAVRFVPYVPSNNREVKLMLEAADIRPGQTVYDLGCGDARLLIEAAKTKQAKAIGFEISPFVYLLARVRNWRNGAKVKIHMKNFFKRNLSDADVVFCYLFPRIMNKLKEKFERELRPGTKVVSNAFKIEGWKDAKIVQTREDKPEAFLIRVYEMGNHLP